MKPIVRESTKNDIAVCEDLIKEFCEEMRMEDVGFVHDSKRYLEVAEALAGPSTFVMERDGKIIGFCVGMIGRPMLGKESVYQEIVWFVTKSERRYGMMLLDAVESFCRKNFIDKIVFASINSVVGLKVESFYLKKGFKLLEKHFIKEVK